MILEDSIETEYSFFFFHSILKDIKSQMFPDYSSEEFKEMALIEMALNVGGSFLRGNLKLGWGSDSKEQMEVQEAIWKVRL